MKKLLLIFIVSVAAIWQYDQNRVMQQSDGIVAKAYPIQNDLNDAPAFMHDGYSFTPLANFAVEARVLSRKKYSSGREGDLSPLDLALGWGPMSDNKVLEKIEISQGNRFYYWRVKEYPIPKKDIIQHSSNMHMIPANKQIEKQLAAVREGNVVTIIGQLVKINKDDGWRWKSSLSRTDTGAGACELIWVKEVVIL